VEEDNRTFVERIDDIVYGPSFEQEDEQDNPTEDPESQALDEGAPGDEPDNPDVDPNESTDAEEAEVETEGETEPEGDAQEPEVDEPAPDTEAETDEDDQQIPEDLTVEVQTPDGVQEVTLEELRRGYMRQADYTRKTQEVSEERNRLAESAQSRSQLAREMGNNAAMRDFLSKHPEAVSYLMQDPDATRALIQQGESEIKAFAEDYETLIENPRLAERFEDREPEEASEELQQQRRMQAITTVTQSLDNAIDQIGQEFSDVDADDVAEYVMELGGVPYDQQEPAFQDVFAGVQRLYKMFFINDGEQVSLDTRMIRKEFERQQKLAAVEQKRQDSEADRHNERVEAELERQGQDDDEITATPEGDSPGQKPERGPDFKSFRDALDSIEQIG